MLPLNGSYSAGWDSSPLEGRGEKKEIYHKITSTPCIKTTGVFRFKHYYLYIHIVSLVLNKTGFPMPKQGMLPEELDTLSGSDK